MNVAIIGAGINGLYLSWKLAEKGHKVVIFEKNRKIGDKICSGLFSERILDYIPESKKLIENRIDYCLLHFPKKTVRINFFHPVRNKISNGAGKFLVMERSKLDKLAASLARKRGVRIILNKEIKRFPFGFDRIIGSDGANSIVRQKLKLPSPKLRLGIQGFINKKSKTKANFVETWPTKNGFIWKIPRGSKIEYGIIEEINSAKKLFDDFLVENDIKIKNIGSKLIPQGLIIPRNPTITLSGDAAGLTKPWSSGGVIWGLKGAKLLSDTFPDFLTYRRQVLKFFLPKIIIGKMAVKTAYTIGFKMPYLLPKNIKIESDFIL